jgi:hypothetical protein
MMAEIVNCLRITFCKTTTCRYVSFSNVCSRWQIHAHILLQSDLHLELFNKMCGEQFLWQPLVL